MNYLSFGNFQYSHIYTQKSTLYNRVCLQSLSKTTKFQKQLSLAVKMFLLNGFVAVELNSWGNLSPNRALLRSLMLLILLIQPLIVSHS